MFLSTIFPKKLAWGQIECQVISNCMYELLPETENEHEILEIWRQREIIHVETYRSNTLCPRVSYA